MQRYDTNCISAFINGFYRRIVKRSVSGAAASTGKFIVDIYISTPLYNFINDTLVSESTVLRHLLRHLILYRFRLFP